MTLTPYRMNFAVVAVASALVLGSAVSTVPAGPTVRAQAVSRHRPGSGSGNLVVVVPPIPKHGQLRKLCRALLEAPGGGPGAERARATLEAPEVAANSPTDAAPGIQLLTDGTGGTKKSAVSWCRGYLRPHPPRG